MGMFLYWYIRTVRYRLQAKHNKSNIANQKASCLQRGDDKTYLKSEKEISKILHERKTTMKNIKKATSFTLAFIMFISVLGFNTNSVYAFSEGEIQSAPLDDINALNSHLISVTPVQQSTTYYCGVACAVMAAKALGLGTYSQNSMASILNTTTAGTNSANIVSALNSLLSSAGISKRYTRKIYSNVTTSEIVSSIRSNVPVFASVNTLPYNPNEGGHFILIVGYYYTEVPGEETSSSSDIPAETRRPKIHFNIIDPHYNNQYFGRHVLTWGELYASCKNNNGYFVYKA